MAQSTAHAHPAHAHPSLNAYVRIAIMLAIITAVEVAIYYLPFMHSSGMLVPTLIVLSAIKFVTVVAYFMHLKFDEKMLTFAFTASMVISIIMFIALWVIMHYDAPTIFNANMSLLPQKPERP